MKKLIIIIISAILLLSASAMAIFAITSNDSPAPSEKIEENEVIETPKIPAFDVLCATITSSDTTFSLSNFTQKEIFADLSRDNLREVFAAFDVVLEKYDTIEIKDTMYHRYLLDNENLEYTTTDDINLCLTYMNEKDGDKIVLAYDAVMKIPTDQDPNALKYAMLTSVYMELFPDNWTYGFTPEQIHKLNHIWQPVVYVIPDHEDYGYKTAFDAFQSYSGTSKEQFRFGPRHTISGTQIEKQMADILANSSDPAVLEWFLFEMERYRSGNDIRPLKHAE